MVHLEQIGGDAWTRQKNNNGMIVISVKGGGSQRVRVRWQIAEAVHQGNGDAGICDFDTKPGGRQMACIVLYGKMK